MKNTGYYGSKEKDLLGRREWMKRWAKSLAPHSRRIKAARYVAYVHSWRIQHGHEEDAI